MTEPPQLDLSTITDAATLKQRVAEVLTAGGRPDLATVWQQETAGNDSMNGLHIKARQFVQIATWPPPRHA